MGKIVDFLTGGFGTELVKGGMDIIRDRFPGKMSEADEKAVEVELMKMANSQALKLQNIANEDQINFNQRINDLEGTASDLKTIPIIGAMVIFMRGVQRPFWGFATFYLDNKWFFGNDEWSDKQDTTLLVINILVLGFLFGERTLKNLEPLLIKVFGRNN